MLGRLCAAALAACAIIAPAHAIVAEPPPEYLGYAGRLVVIELPQRLVHGVCAPGLIAAGSRLAVTGCAWPKGASCIIVVPMAGVDGVDARRRAALERHETAHCAGWTHP